MKTLPNAPNAERSVLASAFMDPESLDVVADVLTADDFNAPGNARIFECAMWLHGNGAAVDSLTLREEIARRGWLARVGGDEYLVGLCNVVPEYGNVLQHAKIVRDKSIARRIIMAAREIEAAGFGDYGTIAEYADHADKAIFAATQCTGTKAAIPFREALSNVVKKIQAASARKQTITGIPTGFGKVDRLLAGMQLTDLIVLAARPGMGKSAFALAAMINAARAGWSSAGFLLEMSDEQWAVRAIGSEARVDLADLRTGAIKQDGWTRVMGAASDLSGLGVYLNDTPGITITQLRSQARRLKSQHGISLVVVDYIQLMRAGFKTGSREQEVAEISRALKALAKELGIVVLGLAQLNRDCEKRADKRPMLSDLRESGSLEQDADVIAFLYRDEVYTGADTQCPNECEVNVAKHRSGPTGTVKVRFDREFTRFDNLADEWTHEAAE